MPITNTELSLFYHRLTIQAVFLFLFSTADVWRTPLPEGCTSLISQTYLLCIKMNKHSKCYQPLLLEPVAVVVFIVAKNQ